MLHMSLVASIGRQFQAAAWWHNPMRPRTVMTGYSYLLVYTISSLAEASTPRAIAFTAAWQLRGLSPWEYKLLLSLLLVLLPLSFFVAIAVILFHCHSLFLPAFIIAIIAVDNVFFGIRIATCMIRVAICAPIPAAAT